MDKEQKALLKSLKGVQLANQALLVGLELVDGESKKELLKRVSDSLKDKKLELWVVDNDLVEGLEDLETKDGEEYLLLKADDESDDSDKEKDESENEPQLASPVSSSEKSKEVLKAEKKDKEEREAKRLELTRGYNKLLVGRRPKLGNVYKQVLRIDDRVGPTGNKLLYVECEGVSFTFPVEEALEKLSK